MYARMIHNKDGSKYAIPYGKDEQAIFSGMIRNCGMPFFLFKESILESELNIIKDGQRPKSVKHFYAIVARSINFADYVL